MCIDKRCYVWYNMNMKLIDNKTDLNGMDCHLHSPFSPDAKRMGASDPFEIADAARERGLKGFIATDHVDVGHWQSSPPVDFDAYFTVWEKVRKANPDLKIYVGLEVGFEIQYVEQTYKLVKDLPVEYVINSVHYWKEPVKSESGYDNYYIYGKHAGYEDYLRAVSASLDVPYGFNTIGHLGFPERYAPFPENERAMGYDEFKPLFDEIIRKAVARGVRFELNTNVQGELCHPRADFLRAYKKAGGVRPVLGSDAHVSANIAKRFDEATEFLNKIFGA